MGSNINLNPVIPALAGTTVATGTVSATVETCTLSATTAQSSLNFAGTVIRIENESTTASVVVSLGASTEFSGGGIGAYSVTIATAQTKIIGGVGFESARFLTSAGTLVLTFSPSTATCIVQAFMSTSAIRHA